MKRTTLGQSGLEISVLGIGTNKVGGHNYYKDLSEQEGKDFVKRSIELGINFIDTADVYGHGRSEELIGEVLREIDTPRDAIVLATKGGVEWEKDRKNNKPAYLRQALEASLKRLNQDYVDLYYLHFPDEDTPISESVGELSRLKEEGKIRAIGVSNLNLDQLKEATQTADIAALQSGYNMFDRRVEADVLPFCAEKGISFIPYFPLASGLLGGRYKVTDPVPPGRDAAAFRTMVEKADQLKTVAQKLDVTLPNLALAWLLAQKGVDAVIPGGRRPEQVEGLLPAANLTLTAADLKEIEAILA
ncbi:aldo/keto reductase [Pullulanibacillus sp. KACC 23026]|uniref:aldo/keto reductase n=1 Tax=Pullulanibacillus sp. KACC 23026 TaxID=3028315 RepID=UPI0023B05C34|nr:aldo/keto reductase [Pullulanibacillus sp. KACC 23026]WEG12572.1 aldo/keto reductase [Pullulanibacillus sp. KACC 23026]